MSHGRRQQRYVRLTYLQAYAIMQTMEIRPTTLDRPDDASQLFGEWDERGFIAEAAEKAKKKVVKDIGREAVVQSHIDKDVTPHHFSLDNVIEDIARRRSAEREDAYSDLGGGVHQFEYGRNRDFVAAIDAYEPWHDETRDAVERFRLYDMTAASFDAMTQEDRRRFSLHSFSFLDKVKKLHHFIDIDDGRVAQGSFLYNRFGSHHAPSELQSYSQTLTHLIKGIAQTGLDEKIRAQVGIPPVTWSNYSKKRTEALKKAVDDERRHGSMGVVYERGKFRVETKDS